MKNYIQTKYLLFFVTLLVMIIGGFHFNSTNKAEALYSQICRDPGGDEIPCGGGGGGGGLANLTASAPTPTAATVNVAKSFTSTISNIKNFSTLVSFQNLFQTSPSPTGASGVVNYLVTPNMPTLAGNATAITSKSITFSSAGTMYIRACANTKSSLIGDGDADEYLIDDNCSPWTMVIVSPPAVNGACSGTHYICYGGTSVSNVNGATAYTWGCNGSGGGTSTGATACSETKTVNSFKNSMQVATGPGGTGTISTIASTPSPMTNLGAGQSATASSTYTFTGGTVPRTQSVRFCADQPPLPNGVITESIETNNCSPWRDVTVTASLSGPDLTAGQVTPSTAEKNVSKTFSSVIKNIGNQPTPSVTRCTGPSTNRVCDNYFTAFPVFFQIANAPNGGGIIEDQPFSRIDGGLGISPLDNSTDATYSYVFPTSGTYSIRACADKYASNSIGPIVESNENNNCSSPWTNVTVPGPDLIAGVVTSNPTNPVMNTPPTATVLSSIITNQGTASTGSTPASFSNFFQISTDGGATSIDLPATTMTTPLDYIGASKSKIATTSYIFLSARTYSVRACADKSDRNSVDSATGAVIAESNENNNCSAWIPIEVLAACASNKGNPCSSTNNSCNPPKTNNGTIGCDGTCSATLPSCSGTGGTCTTTHYKCSGDDATTNSGTNQISSPTKWTWTCGSAPTCSEKKSPGYIEN